MIEKILSKLFGTKKDRVVKKLLPVVKSINQYYNSYSELTDEQLRAKTGDFKARIQNGTPTLSLIPEAFAVVKEACRRMCGKSWTVDGRMQEWNMIPYDVQLMGGTVLAQGNIAEMATGEGKTLVALFPTYLHALAGKGVHIVTVNDYLAKRDRDWMGYVLEFLGLSVGVITEDVRESRKEEYAKDVTYGVNHAFGFDYLRDNMVHDVREMVQRGFHFCLIDEVDSILIDDARVPLIISDSVENEIGSKFMEMKPRVFDLVSEQSKLVNKLVSDAESKLEAGQKDEAYFLLLQASKGLPKNKRLAKVLNQQGVKKNVQDLEGVYIRDKKMNEVTEDLFYAIEEKSHIVDLMTKGHEYLTRTEDDHDVFMLPDLSGSLQEIEAMNFSEAKKEELRENLQAAYSDKSDKIHTIHQLLKAYCLWEKDVEYVVQDGRVIIVDQSTGRLKMDSRYSDGLHQAIEAKEGVKIGKDSQTVATVTYQNYFRMYKFLSGMTGTAVTEENEFFDIYKLEVVEIPTNVPVIRNDEEDYIYMTKREKYNAVVEEVKKLNQIGRPVLIGTPDVDVSEIMHKLLDREKIEHKLLNAKNHASEADIVRFAGQRGAITIATNMAGRGTDIKLGDGIKELGGLAIIGCERHDSRRIDRQLRGRAGRQGDPGSSKFFVSLEDKLMRLFGSDRIASIMDRFGHEAGEPIAHPWITKSIERAQKKVEAHNFSSRKYVIEYDDVMNKKRNVIYIRRRAALIKGALSEGINVPFAREYGVDPDEKMEKEVSNMIGDFLQEAVRQATSHTHIIEDWDIASLRQLTMKTMLLDFQLKDIEIKTSDDLVSYLSVKALEKFKQKEIIITEPMMVFLCKIAILRTIDINWRQHLLDDDNLQRNIRLLAHGQKDPLVEYKKLSYLSFAEMMFKVNQEALEFIFRAKFQVEVDQEEEVKAAEAKKLASLKSNVDKTIASAEKKPEKAAPVRIVAKAGRNDLCPCGSGKKYKSCHGQEE